MKYQNLIIYLSLITLILSLFIPSLNENMEASTNLFFSVASFFSIIFYLYTFKNIYKSWVRFETLFLIGYIIVHFQIPFLYSLGIEPNNPSFVWLNKQVVNFATWFSAISIHLWMIGSTFYIIKNKLKQKITPIQHIKYDIRKLDYILLISFLGFFGLAGTSLLKGSHDGMGSWGEGASYFMIILRVSLYFRIYLFFKNLKKINLPNLLIGNTVFLSVLLIYILTFLLIGDRGPFLQIGIVIMLCYGMFIKKISMSKLIFLVLVGAVLLSIIGLGRSVENGNMFEAGFSKYQDKGVNPTEELATSVRIMYRAFTHIPQTYDYFYGLQFLIGILGIIPFASGFLIKILNIPTEFTASSRLFTYIGQGNNVTYGEGTEILSDIYINFGIYGVFIIMFLYGFYSSKVTFKAIIKRSDIYFLILIIITSTSIYINRAQFLMPLKDIFYIFLIYLFIRKKVKKLA